jgi:hypothetical protein
MARWSTRRRRSPSRRRSTYRSGRGPRAGVDPLFWVALAVAALVVLFVLTR